MSPCTAPSRKQAFGKVQARFGVCQAVLERVEWVRSLSVNASGTNFVLAVEADDPNQAAPGCLLVQSGGVREWEGGLNNWPAPVYAGDALVRLTYSGFPTATYWVELEGVKVYSGTVYSPAVSPPRHALGSWGGRWLLAGYDRVVLDGQDVGRALGYDKLFGLTTVRGRPFYFFERDGVVRISYGGRTLRQQYDEVLHDMCCEPAQFNIRSNRDMVWFFARREGTWYYVEIGVYGPDPGAGPIPGPVDCPGAAGSG